MVFCEVLVQANCQCQMWHVIELSEFCNEGTKERVKNGNVTRSRYWLETINTISRTMQYCASVSVRTPHKLTTSPAAASNTGLYRRASLFIWL